MIFETGIEVRYPDTDPMGIVHHSVYPVWYEVARMDLFSKIGFSYNDMHAMGINPPMVNLNMRYISPAYYPETLTIRTRVLSVAQKKLELSYEVCRPGADKPIAAATSFHIWTGPDMKSLDMEKALPEVYARFVKALDSGGSDFGCQGDK